MQVSPVVKKVSIVVCVLVLYLVLFANMVRESAEIVFGAAAATVLTVFLYKKIAKKTGL